MSLPLHSPEQVERHAHVICEYMRTGELAPYKAGHKRRFPTRMSIYALHRAYVILYQEKFKLNNADFCRRCHQYMSALAVVHWTFRDDKSVSAMQHPMYNHAVAATIGNCGYNARNRLMYVSRVFQEFNDRSIPPDCALTTGDIVAMNAEGKLVKATADTQSPIGVATSPTTVALSYQISAVTPKLAPARKYPWYKKVWYWVIESFTPHRHCRTCKVAIPRNDVFCTQCQKGGAEYLTPGHIDTKP